MAIDQHEIHGHEIPGFVHPVDPLEGGSVLELKGQCLKGEAAPADSAHRLCQILAPHQQIDVPGCPRRSPHRHGQSANQRVVYPRPVKCIEHRAKFVVEGHTEIVATAVRPVSRDLFRKIVPWGETRRRRSSSWPRLLRPGPGFPTAARFWIVAGFRLGVSLTNTLTASLAVDPVTAWRPRGSEDHSGGAGDVCRALPMAAPPIPKAEIRGVGAGLTWPWRIGDNSTSP